MKRDVSRWRDFVLSTPSCLDSINLGAQPGKEELVLLNKDMRKLEFPKENLRRKSLGGIEA